MIVMMNDYINIKLLLYCLQLSIAYNWPIKLILTLSFSSVTIMTVNKTHAFTNTLKLFKSSFLKYTLLVEGNLQVTPVQ